MDDDHLTLDWEEAIDGVFADMDPSASAEPEPGPPAETGLPGLIDTLSEEEGRLDAYGVLLVRVFAICARFLKAARGDDADQAREAALILADLTAELTGVSVVGPRVVIRHRGLGTWSSGGEAIRRDYVITAGGVTLDSSATNALSSRLDKEGAPLPRAFDQAAEVFANTGITSLALDLDTAEEAGRRRLLAAAKALVSLLAALAPATGEGQPPPDRPESDLFVCTNEQGRPDINLSLLAAVNPIRPATLSQAVTQVTHLLRRAGARDPLARYPSAYEALFAFKKVRDTLVRPSIEINNVRWIASASGQGALEEDHAAVVRLVSSVYGAWNLKSARILDTLFGEHDTGVDPAGLADRLRLLSDFLEGIEKNADRAHSTAASAATLLELVERRLETVPDAVLSRMSAKKNTVSAVAADDTVVTFTLASRIVDILALFTQRVATKRKMKAVLTQKVGFSPADYESIADQFGIRMRDARELVSLLVGCFDAGGRFDRQAFARNVASFLKHERYVFEFLWHFLKESVHTDDRIALLNSLSTLEDRMKEPERALSVLLEDLLSDTEKVRFSDRNALILCNTLMRKFNQELNTDITATPPDVLDVEEGLDRRAASFVADYVTANENRVFAKIRAIHTALADALDPYAYHRSLPVGAAIAMETEAYILLSLAGGAPAVAIIRSALREYGNPCAALYGHAQSVQQHAQLLKVLAVLIRGIGRVGEAVDVVFLSETRFALEAICKTAAKSRTGPDAEELDQWIEQAISRIQGRS